MSLKDFPKIPICHKLTKCHLRCECLYKNIFLHLWGLLILEKIQYVPIKRPQGFCMTWDRNKQTDQNLLIESINHKDTFLAGWCGIYYKRAFCHKQIAICHNRRSQRYQKVVINLIFNYIISFSLLYSIWLQKKLWMHV